MQVGGLTLLFKLSGKATGDSKHLSSFLLVRLLGKALPMDRRLW